MAENKDLEILAAADGKEITVAGTTVRVKPYNWKTTFKMAKPLNTILKALYDNGGIMNAALAGNEEFLSVFSLLDRIGDTDEISTALSDLIGAAIDQDKAWLEGLMLDDMITLGKAVYEVNRDFFAKRIAPLLPKQETEKAGKQPPAK